MKKYFNNDEDIIRFKYSAISILRSANKKMFIDNIYNLFNYSKNESTTNQLLFQNIFYHIYTYIKRNYHRSESDFSKICFELEKILKTNDISDNLRHTARYLFTYTQVRKAEILLINKSNKVIIKELINFVKELFDEIKENSNGRSHDSISVIYNDNIFPKYYDKKIRNLQMERKNKKDFEELFKKQHFISWYKMLPEKWDYIARKYINKIIVYFGRLEQLFGTNLFDKFENLINFVNESQKNHIMYGCNDDFTLSYINKIIKNPIVLSDKEYYEKFISKYEYFNDLFFHYNKDNIESSCMIWNFCHQFPAELNSICEDVKADSINKLSEKSIDLKIIESKKIENKVYLYIPNSLLVKLFEQVFYHNIIKHYSSNNIEVFIDYEDDLDEYYIIKITTKGTKPNSTNFGGLRECIEVINEYYEGKCSSLYNNEKSLFEIIIKIKRW